MLIKIESIRCPDVTGLMSGCLRNCRPDTPVYAIKINADGDVVFATEATTKESHMVRF